MYYPSPHKKSLIDLKKLTKKKSRIVLALAAGLALAVLILSIGTGVLVYRAGQAALTALDQQIQLPTEFQLREQAGRAIKAVPQAGYWDCLQRRLGQMNVFQLMDVSVAEVTRSVSICLNPDTRSNQPSTEGATDAVQSI